MASNIYRGFEYSEANGKWAAKHHDPKRAHLEFSDYESEELLLLAIDRWHREKKDARIAAEKGQSND